MILKGAIALLVAGLICFSVYSFTSRPNYDTIYEMGESTLHTKLMTSEILPKTAYSQNTLRIKMQNATKDEYRYIGVKWFRNNSEIFNHNEPTLPPSKFFKGDRIRAEVNLLGPNALDVPVITRTVTIRNTPPQIIEASTLLDTHPTDLIRARVNAVDADRDKIRYRYRWYINNNEVVGENNNTLNVGLCKKGDDVYTEIVATDGKADSPPHKSESIKIGSDGFGITSQPPSKIGEDRVYAYQIVTDATDPESLTYSFVTSPSGMKISETGLIDWELPEAKVGSQSYKVVVRVVDATGTEAFQEFEINVTGTKKYF